MLYPLILNRINRGTENAVRSVELIAIVIACVRHMRQLRGEVILRSVPPQPMKVLRASGIERIATLEDERSLVHES